MININIPDALSDKQRYQLIIARLEAILASESDSLANLCNVMSFLYWTIGDINWVGLYILRNGELVLGPFGGKPACSRIPIGKGVCGTAAQSGKVQIVHDVHTFPGHIACDDASNSEIVIPLYSNGKLWAVLDIDSPITARFTGEIVEALLKISHMIESIAIDAI